MPEAVVINVKWKGWVNTVNISNAQKIYELSKIWKEAAYNFVYWDKLDIDWDEEYKKALAKISKTEDLYDYYKELQRFTALLEDGHTAVTFPGEMMQDPEYFSMLPVFLWKFEDGIRVLGIAEDLEDRIPMGSLLIEIDGVDAAEYIRNNCYPYIWHANENACGVATMNELMFGRRGSGAVFTFANDGRQFEIQLNRIDPSTIKWSQKMYATPKDYSLRTIGSSDVHKVAMTDDGIAVIKMTSFQDDSMPGKIYENYEELKEAKGYIVDVRGNGGGNSSNADAIASLFIDGDFKSCFGETQVYEPTYKAWALFREDFKGLPADEAEKKYVDDKESLKAYKMSRNILYIPDGGENVINKAPGKLDGPVVVLMNENTVSAAEDFVDVMKQYTDAVFVGANTAGTSGQPLFGYLESGGTYRICTRRCMAQNGEDIYNKGFAPDFRIIQTAEDYASGTDPAFEKALEIVRG